MSKYDLKRFLDAQDNTYQIALSEVSSGRKRTHWMWFIFPQILGLGFSAMSRHYSIRDLDEAKCYLEHKVLGNRLVEISNILLSLQTNNAADVFGTPDDMKLYSSMSLFTQVCNAPPVFQKVLDKFFNGSKDKKTLEILGL